jgi:hypothetical protein
MQGSFWSGSYRVEAVLCKLNQERVYTHVSSLYLHPVVYTRRKCRY